MADAPDPVAVTAAFRAALTGREPSSSLLGQLGGWLALEALAPTLIDDPLLTSAVSLLVREVNVAAANGEDLEPARTAARALACAVVASHDPLQFSGNLDGMCSDPVVAELVSSPVAMKCLELAEPPRATGVAGEPATTEVVRSAAALEALARLAVQGHVSKYKVLGVLADVNVPQPLRYARAVIRTVGLAFDQWSAEDEVADVIDILTGAKAPAYATKPDPGELARDEQYRRDIEADAMWVKANVDIARALRGDTLAQTSERMRGALDSLDVVCTGDDRADAVLLRSALRLVLNVLLSLDGSGVQDAASWDISVGHARLLASQAAQLALGAHGLNHWSGDRKLAVLFGWERFARDLAWLQDQLQRDSLYDAAVVLDDVLTIYYASRSYDVTRNDQGIERVLRVLRPAVEGGFAARAGLLRNLSDHVDSLRSRVAANQPDQSASEDLQRRLAAAETVLAAARVRLLAPVEPPGKPREQAADLPPLLAELLGPYPTASSALAEADADELFALAADLADKQAAANPDVMVMAVREKTLRELVRCEDFKGDVAPAATAVLTQLILFVERRMNTQKSSKEYLFNPDANESDLHADLYDWLSQGQLSSATNVEVHEVGAGRVDIQISFPGFHFYLELKADDTAVPVEKKNAYIKQTVSYQSTDVRIGFLVVLRLTPPRGKSPAPHLTDYVSHATVLLEGSASERHVVMLEVPGSQTRPSDVR